MQGKGEGITQLTDFRADSSQKLADLLSDVQQHNQQHGPGAQMGRSLGRFLGRVIENNMEGSSKEGEPRMEAAQAETSLESAQEARVRLGQLLTMHEKVLTRFGLALSHQENPSLKIGVPAGPLSLKVTDIYAFLRYVRSMPAQNNTGASEAFANVMQSVEAQIRRIDFQHPSPESAALLEHLDELPPAFKRLDAALDTRDLEQYADFNKTGRLQNYLRIERESLWKSPGKGFGPADWVLDISPPALDKKWAHALDVLRVEKQTASGSVATELKSHLLLCLDAANKNLETIRWSDNYNFKDDFKKIMEKYRSEIESAA